MKQMTDIAANTAETSTATATKKVGYSLSGCVRDVIKGNVKIEDVAFIIAGTRIADRAQIPAYAATEVSPKNVDAFIAAVETLWDRGAIFQACTRANNRRGFNQNWRDASPDEALFARAF